MRRLGLWLMYMPKSIWQTINCVLLYRMFSPLLDTLLKHLCEEFRPYSLFHHVL